MAAAEAPGHRSNVSAAFSNGDAAELAARYEEDGFVALPCLLTAGALRNAQSAANDLIRKRCRSFPASWLLGLHQLNQPSPQSWILSIATDPTVCALLSRVLHDSPVLISSQLFVKLPACEKDSDESCEAVPWHQDATASGHTITLWIALDDMHPTGSNGALILLPGLHRNGALPTEPCVATSAAFDRIRPDLIQTHLPRAVRYTFAAGCAGLHGPYTPHSSAANVSNRPRRVLVLRYCAEGAAVVKGEMLWGPSGEVARAGSEPRHQIPCWSTGEFIDRRAVLCAGVRGVAESATGRSYTRISALASRMPST
eukprot:scaffold6503_cov115-Isochrysis_galbana.AAC.4